MLTVIGVCPVLAVPFDRTGAVDLASFRRLVERVYAAGAPAVMLFGLASEFYKLDDAERLALRDALLDATRAREDRIAVISVTDHATELAVAGAQAAAAAGADAINLLPPHLLGPSRQAVTAHIAAVLTAVDIPVIVQYAPKQTGTALAPDDLLELAGRHANLRQVKVETEPPGRYIEAIGRGDPPLAGIVGYAGVQLPDALQRGAVAVQPGCSFTELYIELWRRHEAGDAAGFAALHTEMLPYLAYWMQSVELIVQAEKTILAERGIVADDYCRRPGWPLDAGERAMIDRFLTQFSDQLRS